MTPLLRDHTRYATEAMVATVDHLATGAGLAVLHQGGNAVDAAIAANAVLAVTSPHMCGMGGDLFALVHRDGEPLALNASGRAGSGADPDRLRAEGHHRMPFRGDVRSAPVPGCVDGWLELHRRLGTHEWERLLEPARRYAEHGFPASPTLAAAASAVAGIRGFEDFPEGLRAGQLVRRRDLAGTLEALARNGRTGFYQGRFGHGLLTVGHGEYTAADLDAPLADWVRPVRLEAWGHELWTVPPNSQGYLTLAAAALADRLGLPTDPDDALWAHLLVECARQAGYDRAAELHEHADPAALLSPERLERRRLEIDPDTASELPAPTAAGDTTYLCVVDGARLGVSLIQSNAAGFGCHLGVPGTGVFLHNRGIGFNLIPGHPAEYGPGRRPPHTLSPALVTRGDRLVAVLGTMGGDAQPQILLQLLTRLLAHDQSPGHAVGAGRWVLGNRNEVPFGTWTDPASLVVDVEGHSPPGWRAGLAGRGHGVRMNPPFDDRFGHAQIITVEQDGLAAAADPRPRAGGAAGL